MPWICIQDEKNEITPKNAKKQQPTANQNNTKYQNVSQRGLLHIYCQGGIAHPPAPVTAISYASARGHVSVKTMTIQ